MDDDVACIQSLVRNLGIPLIVTKVSFKRRRDPPIIRHLRRQTEKQTPCPCRSKPT